PPDAICAPTDDCFFFQAEDGIRDFHVTGVQTCALPIFSAGTVATLFNRAKRKGYQVVIVLEGDPLALFEPDAEEGAAGAPGGGPDGEQEPEEDDAEF